MLYGVIMENENIYTLKKSNYNNYDFCLNAKLVIKKFTKIDLVIRLLELVVLIISVILCIKTYKLLYAFILIIVIATIHYTTILRYDILFRRYETKDLEVFHDLYYFYYFNSFVLPYKRQSFRKAFLLNMAFADLELQNFTKFEQCLEVINTTEFKNFRKMRGYNKSKEHLIISIKKMYYIPDNIRSTLDLLEKE